ncbi:MAG: hypothetical protein KAT85_08105, partial [candidate division Zixibacteria bacterium]|nr:hypothetical protein [candidate division Zixibacteria bacterium]
TENQDKGVADDLMDEFKLRAADAQEVDRQAVENLVEDIRLISLNMAILAAKLNIEDNSRKIVRRKISELVNLSLDTVNHLARVLKALNSGKDSEKNDPAENLTQLEEIEATISRRAQEIVQILSEANSNV